MNIVLTGMRGTGKSTLGMKIAKVLDREFVDMDSLIEERVERSIQNIVENDGWHRFRELELAVSKELGTKDGLVISTGGGTMMFKRNVDALKSNGKVVLLVCDLEVSAKRIYGDENRPSLGGKKSTVEELGDVWSERKNSYYAVADFVYDTNNDKSMEAQVEDIIKLYDGI